MTCQAPGPDGLRCDLPAAHEVRYWHSHTISRGFDVHWRGDEEVMYVRVDGPVARGLAAISTALHAIGDACRAGAR